MKTMSGNGGFKRQQSIAKNVLLVLGGTALLLLVPLTAMQFTNEVVWDLFDFLVAGVLLAGTGIAYVFAASRVSNPQNRAIIGAVLGSALLVVWAELAVGIFH